MKKTSRSSIEHTSGKSQNGKDASKHSSASKLIKSCTTPSKVVKKLSVETLLKALKNEQATGVFFLEIPRALKFPVLDALEVKKHSKQKAQLEQQLVKTPAQNPLSEAIKEVAKQLIDKLPKDTKLTVHLPSKESSPLILTMQDKHVEFSQSDHPELANAIKITIYRTTEVVQKRGEPVKTEAILEEQQPQAAEATVSDQAPAAIMSDVLSDQAAEEAAEEPANQEQEPQTAEAKQELIIQALEPALSLVIAEAEFTKTTKIVKAHQFEKPSKLSIIAEDPEHTELGEVKQAAPEQIEATSYALADLSLSWVALPVKQQAIIQVTNPDHYKSSEPEQRPEALFPELPAGERAPQGVEVAGSTPEVSANDAWCSIS